MATRAVVELSCDKGNCKSQVGIETVQMGWAGKDIELELCSAHRRSLDKMMAELLPLARTSSKTTAHRNGRDRSAAKRDLNRRVREWAKEHGHEVSERGRIRAELVDLAWGEGIR